MIQKTNSAATIHLDRLKSNINQMSSYLDQDTRIMAVVKANAYGHGAVEVAKAIEPLVGAFAVNNINEGIELRNNGISLPILAFGVPEKETASTYRVHNLMATISAESHFDWLPSGTSYHLNFDTGMGRLGFHPNEVERVLELVKTHGELFCTGIYSHYATASDPGSKHVKQQQQTFEKIRSHFPDQLMTHMPNTGGIAFYQTDPFNMVRLGIGMYGYPSGDTSIEGLKPVLEWKTRLVQVKEVDADTTVSYGARWRAPENGYLGIIPVGYEDGLRRNLSGRIPVRIDGKTYPCVGTITMNYTMVFLGDDYYAPGTEVELLYPEYNAADWAKQLNTISYEILTNICPNIPRKYVS